MTELTREEKVSIMAQGYADPTFFAKFFLPDMFPGPIPWVHRGLIAILTRNCSFLQNDPQLDKIMRNFVWEDDKKEITQIFFIQDGKLRMALGRFTLIMLPRGFSKTTIGGILIPLYNILYGDTPFTVYISHAGTHARMQLDNVKLELSTNSRILDFFGETKPKMSDDEKWNNEMFETKTGMTMLARGAGSQIRGMNHKGRRPDTIICDDLEDLDSVATAEQRSKFMHWFLGSLKPAIGRMNPKATITLMGTLLHKDALLAALMKDPQWTVIRFGALDQDGDLLWEANMNFAALEEERKSYAMQGKLHVYKMEYFNEAIDQESQPFKERYIHHSMPPELLVTAIYVDPAVSSARTADSTVITVAGIAADSGKIWFLDQWGKQGATPRELIDRYFEMAEAYGCRFHGIEAIAYQAALIHFMQEEMFRKNYFFEPIPVTHARRTNGKQMKKEERIMLILQARYASGYIHHAVSFPELEAQLLDFDANGNTHDDYIDSAAGVVGLFDPVAAAVAADEDLSKSKFPKLQGPGGTDWRWA